MCYESLLNGDATERPLHALRREERSKAFQNGVAAGGIVVAVLLMQGADLGLVAVLAVAAIALGTLLHQGLLVGAVLALRSYRHVARRFGTAL